MGYAFCLLFLIFSTEDNRSIVLFSRIYGLIPIVFYLSFSTKDNRSIVLFCRNHGLRLLYCFRYFPRKTIDVLFYFAGGCEGMRCDYYSICESDGKAPAKCVCPSRCVEVGKSMTDYTESLPVSYKIYNLGVMHANSNIWIFMCIYWNWDREDVFGHCWHK